MWLFEDKEAEIPEKCFGFVYMITNLTNGRKYIGRKYVTKAATKTVKGKKKKIRVESDWKTYWSSSPKLKADIELLGEHNFKREILLFCFSRGETNYEETRLIFEHNALLDDEYYNEVVQCRIHKSHLKSMLQR